MSWPPNPPLNPLVPEVGGWHRQPCECGSPEAVWHGAEDGGLREYSCNDCWNRRQRRQAVSVVSVTADTVHGLRGVVGWTRGQDLEGAYNVWRGPVIVAYGTTRKAADAAARLLGGVP